MGDQGPAVIVLRVILGCPSFVFADTFDGGLDSVVRRFQLRRGLAPDGIVGPLTWGRIADESRSFLPLSPLE